MMTLTPAARSRQNLRRLRAQAWPILETAGAALVAWYLAKVLLGDRETGFAPIAAVICLGATMGQQRGRRARLVLQREKNEPLGGTGPLARDDHAGDADAAALPGARQIARAQDAAHGQLLTAQRHGVAAGSQAHSGVVGNEALGFGHGFERARVGII